MRFPWFGIGAELEPTEERECNRWMSSNELELFVSRLGEDDSNPWNAIR